MSCPRAALYKLVHRREKLREAEALFFGKALHEGLAVRYAHPDGVMPTSDVQKLMHEKVIQFYHGHHTPDFDHRTLDCALETLSRYNKTYAFETFSIYNNPVDGKPAVEIPFCIPLCSIEINADLTFIDIDGASQEPQTAYFKQLDVCFTGRIDMITIEPDGTALINDHKSTSMGGAGLFDDYENSLQFKGYNWASRRMFPARPRLKFASR